MTKSDDLQVDRVNKILEADDLKQAWQELLALVHHFGFEKFVYATNRLMHIGSYEDKQDSLILSDCSDEFIGPFWHDNLYLDTPVCKWLIKNTGSRSLEYGSKKFHAGVLSAEEAVAQSALMETGVTSGYVIGYNTETSSTVSGFGLLNFGAAQETADRQWQLHGAKLEAYCHIFHLKAQSFPVPLAHKSLTERQKEVLRWVGAGKTNAEVATILGVSPAAIEKHLRRVREILKVSTTTQAVLHAELTSNIFTTRPNDE